MTIQQVLLGSRGGGSVLLIPWDTQQRPAGNTGWTVVGTAGQAFRTQGDGNYVLVTLANGNPDSNGIDGRDYCLPGGSAFSWTGKTPTNVKVEFYLYNLGPQSYFGLAAYIANLPQTWFVETFNAAISLTGGVWYTVYNGNDANALAAIAAGNFLTSAICFNHAVSSTTMMIEAMRITVDYT